MTDSGQSDMRMVWVVTQFHEDDREVVRGVFDNASSAYEFAEGFDPEPAPWRAPSVMAHHLRTWAR